MPAPLAETILPATFVKLRWEEPLASSGLDRKDLAIIPKGVYRGFVPSPAGAGSNILNFAPGSTGESVAVFETTGALAAGVNFNPTSGWNVTVFTTTTPSVDYAGVPLGLTAVVLRTQYNEGGTPPTQAFIHVVNLVDVQSSDVVLVIVNKAVVGDFTGATITPGVSAQTVLPPFVTVGDGFESKGDFTGNRPNLAGTDTSDVIATAANALAARRDLTGVLSKGVIFVKKGDYTVSATIPLRNRTTLVGEGQHDMVVLRQSAAGVRIFDFDIAGPNIPVEIRVEQVFISGHGAATEPVIRMSGATFIAVRDVTLFCSVSTFAPIQILGASADCVVRDIRRFSAPALADTVLLDGTSTRCRVEGAPLNIRQTGSTSQNEITTSRVTHPGATAVDGTILTDLRAALGAVRDLRLGAVTQYLRGYIRGLDLKATVVPSIGPGVVFVTDGVIEIDGMLYELTVSTDISATGAYAANIYTYFYARRDTATGALAFEGLSGNANHPEYSTAQNAWVKSGTGTGGVPTRRYIGCVLSLIAGAGGYQASIKVGDFMFLDASDGAVGTVNPITIVLPTMSSGTATVSLPLVLSGLPLVESSRGGLLGGGTDFVVGGLDCMIDFEVRVAYFGATQNNKVCTLTIGGPYTQRTSLAANFIQQTGSPAIIAHRFPAVRALARVRSSTTGLFLAAPDLTIRATISGLSAGGPAETAVATVVAYQRGFVDVR